MNTTNPLYLIVITQLTNSPNPNISLDIIMLSLSLSLSIVTTIGKGIQTYCLSQILFWEGQTIIFGSLTFVTVSILPYTFDYVNFIIQLSD